MPFIGTDRVEILDCVCYSPVRIKANDADAALDPFRPFRKTYGIGYLRPPFDGSENRNQEFIKNWCDFHNFNG